MSKPKGKREHTDYARFVEVTARSATAQAAADELGLSIQAYRTKAYQLRKGGVTDLKKFPRRKRIDYQELEALAKKLKQSEE